MSKLLLALGLCLTLAAVGGACSGSVDQGGLGGDDEDLSSSGEGAGYNSSGGCVECGGPCGFCDEYEDQLTFKCATDSQPLGPGCRKTGSLFFDGLDYYQCYHCDI